MSAPVIPSAVRRDGPTLPRLAQVAGAGSSALGAGVLLGWAVGNQALMQLVSGAEYMSPVGAVGLVLLGFAIVGLVAQREWVRHLGLAAAALAGLLAGVSLLEYAGGRNLLMVQALFPSVNDYPDRGRMPPATAVEVLLLVTALLAVARRQRVLGQVLGVLALTGSMVAVLGYLYGARDLYASEARSGMALNAAVGLMMLSVGLLAAIPNGLLPCLVRAPGPAPLLSRRLFPVVMIALPAIGWAGLTGEKNGWYTIGFGVSIMMVAAGALVIFAAWRAVREVDRSAASLRPAGPEFGQVEFGQNDSPFVAAPTPARPGPGRADRDPVHPALVHPDPVHLDPVHPDPVNPALVHPAPEQTSGPTATRASIVVQVESPNVDGEDQRSDSDSSRGATASSSSPDIDRGQTGLVASVADELALDLERRSLLVDGQNVDLTRREFDLLAHLYNHRGVALTRRNLMDQVWQPGFPDDSRALDIHVRRIRMKLGRHAHRLSTLRGFGYRFD